jgi:hypothetical protein
MSSTSTLSINRVIVYARHSHVKYSLCEGIVEKRSHANSKSINYFDSTSLKTKFSV